jgi:hypothetical protein
MKHGFFQNLAADAQSLCQLLTGLAVFRAQQYPSHVEDYRFDHVVTLRNKRIGARQSIPRKPPASVSSNYFNKTLPGQSSLPQTSAYPEDTLARFWENN